MAASNIGTIMSGVKERDNHLDSITNYALFMGGTNVTNQVLKAYDPQRTGYGRLFMVRKPKMLDEYFKSTNKMDIFKHICVFG